VALVAAGIFAAFTASASQAALILDYNNNAVVVVDGGAGDLDGVVNGQIINNAVVAGFGVAITVAASNSPGNPAGATLQVQSLDIQNQNPNPASLQIRVSDTNYTQPGGAGSPMLLTSSVGGTFTNGAIGNSASFRSFADPNNSQPAGPVSTAALTFLRTTTAPTESFSGTDFANFVRNAGPFSLANIVSTTLSAGGQLNISGTTTATALVPEPLTAGLLGLAAMTGLRRRR